MMKTLPTLADAGGDQERSGSIFDDAILSWVRKNIIGVESVIPTPFGERTKRYFDYTASGLPFGPIEEQLATRLLPHMANTHTGSNFVGSFVTRAFEDAYRKVRSSTHASEDDLVIFTGSGATGAINKLITALGLKIPTRLRDYVDLDALPSDERPVVLRSRMEHHSNDLPWRESIADVEYVGYDRHGRIDPEDIYEILSRPEYSERRLKIGTFSAASNVTGVRNDCDALAAAMHDCGGVAFFDFAAAGPYVELDMHPRDDERFRKDAVFLSLHKFTGGPQCPGLLIANRNLFCSQQPTEPGGGTVLYTSPWEYRYVDSLEEREHGGTPPVVSVVRAGLVFELKDAIGAERFEALESHCVRVATEAWADHPKIQVLGPSPQEVPRLGILSLILDGGRLHHNLAVRLLSDLFGIQVRGGCMCAGTYGHDLLDIDRETSAEIRALLDAGDAGAKPGWIRVSFGPGTSEDDLDVLIDAVTYVADSWHKHVHEYVMDPETADWTHRDDTSSFEAIALECPLLSSRTTTPLPTHGRGRRHQAGSGGKVITPNPDAWNSER